MSVFKKLFGANDKDQGKSGSHRKETVALEITGMTCAHCATSIEKKFDGKEGVLEKQVSYPEGKGTFVFDPKQTSRKEIIDTINATSSYKVV